MIELWVHQAMGLSFAQSTFLFVLSTIVVLGVVKIAKEEIDV